MLTPALSQKLNRVGDAIILVCASFVAAMSHGELHWKVAGAMAATSLVFWALASRLLRHYDPWNGRGFRGDLVLTALLLAAVVVPMMILRAIVPRYAVTTEVSRFLAVLLPAVLWLRIRVIGLRLCQARRIDRVLIVGVEALGRLTNQEISASGSRQVIGYLRFGDQKEGARLHAPVMGTISDLERILKECVIDEIYFAASDHRPGVQAAIRVCEGFGIPFALPAGGYRFARARCATTADDGYLHYLSVPNKPIQVALKRLADIALSVTALVLLSPLFIVAALTVKLTSAGPIPFRQERVGLRGRTFKMLKFRSMIANAEDLRAKLQASNESSGPVFKMKHDPRVTPVGRFMRKFSIDELPQLIIDHWSFAQDIGLILRTIPVVLTGRGAS
jgi:lipopolysaccharide/colanic/teichoic acid biosynthesis glycosyltransferase